MFTAALVVCLAVIAATVVRTRLWSRRNLITRLPPELPTSVPVEAWNPPAGVVLVGVSLPGRDTLDVDGLTFACWRADPHMLLCGPSGTGKTAATRWLALALIQAGYSVGFIDGKTGGSYACFAGRGQVLGVADEPDEWAELAGLVRDEMRRRFRSLRAWRYGRGDKPNVAPVALVVDELVDVCRAAGDAFTGPLEEIVRMGREGGGRVLASVLRPDIGQSVSGLVRDSLTAKLFLGRPSQTASQMLFDDHAKRVREVASLGGTCPGRGVALLANRVCRVQMPFFPDPIDDPDAAALLPALREELTEFERLVTSRQDVAARIAELRAQGLDYKAVAGALNSDGYRQRDGKLWTQAQARMENGHG